jgi:hypothetical protein
LFFSWASKIDSDQFDLGLEACSRCGSRFSLGGTGHELGPLVVIAVVQSPVLIIDQIPRSAGRPEATDKVWIQRSISSDYKPDLEIEREPVDHPPPAGEDSWSFSVNS